MQVLHRNGVENEEIATRILATFPDVLPGGRSSVERERAVRGRVAIWTSKWADDKAGKCSVSSILGGMVHADGDCLGDGDVSKYSWGPTLLEEMGKPK